MPQPSERHFASSQGSICYFEWGEQGNGPSVLLLHATGFHARCWDKLVDALPGNFHVIAVDQLGHGRSAKPEAITDWAMIADATAELLDELDACFTVAAGHSMGGHCLVQVAANMPERLERLVLIDPVIMQREVYQNSQDYSLSEQMVSKRRNSWSGPDEMFDRFENRHPYRLWDPAVLRDYCEHGLLSDGDGRYQLACPPKTEGSVYGTSVTVDPWPFVDALSQPVTVLRAPQRKSDGGFDFASSPTPSGLADSFANGRDVYLEDLTHFMPMQSPGQIARYIAGSQ